MTKFSSTSAWEGREYARHYFNKIVNFILVKMISFRGICDVELSQINVVANFRQGLNHYHISPTMKTHWLIALMITENDDAKLTVLQATRRALVIPKSDYSPHRSSTTPTCHPLCSINVSFATVHLPHFAARLSLSPLLSPRLFRDVVA